MPFDSHVLTSPLVSSTTTTPIDFDIVDVKLRAEYERDRQLALKGHDARKKLHGKKDLSSSQSTPLGPKRSGLGQRSAWRKSVISLDDMSDYPSEPFSVVAEPDDDRVGKENSRPSPSVSLEDLIRSSVPTGTAGNKKVARPSVSRASLSRQSSCEALSLDGLSLNAPPPSSSLAPISERIPLMATCDSDSDSDSVLDFSSVIDTELISPGAEDWKMEQTQDGCFLFVNLTKSKDSDASPCVGSTVLIQSCDW